MDRIASDVVNALTAGEEMVVVSEEEIEDAIGTPSDNQEEATEMVSAAVSRICAERGLVAKRDDDAYLWRFRSAAERK